MSFAGLKTYILYIVIFYINTEYSVLNAPIMQKTILWEAFSTLDKAELREMGKFVRSPFFNQKQPLIDLFEYLCDCLKQKKIPDTLSAHAAVWPDILYDDQRMRLANSDLLELLEHYWTYCEQFVAPQRIRTRLAAQYRKRNLPKHSQIALREARAALNSHHLRNAEYFDDRGDFEVEQYRFAAAVKRFEAFNLQEISDLMDTAFIARKLRHVCFALSHQAVFKTQYEFGLLEAVFDYVKKTPSVFDQPAVALYYHACCFLAGVDGEVHFERFRLLLTTHAALFPEEEIRALYLLAINFGVKKSNEYGEVWLRATFALYKEALARELLLENGFLSRFAYNNIVGIAMRLEEVEWAEDFLIRYKPLLERRYREASFSLNSARVAYRRKHYGAALQFLQNADYKDFINSMNAKILQMKIYYETEETDILLSHLDSMQNYIRRQGPIGYHRDNYLRIVRYVQALLRIRPGDQTALATLHQKIAAEPILLTEKTWLMAQKV